RRPEHEVVPLVHVDVPVHSIDVQVGFAADHGEQLVADQHVGGDVGGNVLTDDAYHHGLTPDARLEHEQGADGMQSRHDVERAQPAGGGHAHDAVGQREQLQPDARDARSDHADRFRAGAREVDDAAGLERTAVVDAHHD